MGKRRAKPRSAQSQSGESPDLPFPWSVIIGWAPPDLRPLLIVVAMFVALGILLWSPIKDVLDLRHERSRERPIAPIVWIEQVRAGHPEGRYENIFGCVFNFSLIPEGTLSGSTVLSSANSHQMDAFLENETSTLTPAFLIFRFDRKMGEHYDTVSITGLELEVRRVAEFDSQAVLLIQTLTCADQGCLPHIAQAYIRANAKGVDWKRYNVFRSRYTDPDSIQVMSLSDPLSLEPVVIYVSLATPGWYEARLKAEYEYPGSEKSVVYSAPYLLARPDLNKLEKQRLIDLVNVEILGEQDLIDEFFSRYEQITQSDLKLVLRQGVPPAANTIAQFVQLINLGDLDINLENWQLQGTILAQTQQALEPSYIFPPYVLESDNGVRVWIAVGNDAGPDLFWFHFPITPTVGTLTGDSPMSIQLHDDAGQLVGSW